MNMDLSPTIPVYQLQTRDAELKALPLPAKMFSVESF